MHLKTLTIRGFKSFASATTFAFEPGVTAVVGPNGSGKSNVVDALAWVMGEQGAKSLRGGSMEDVIFAGTAERQPLGRAAVSLTIDNSDGALPIDYAEVTISRTMFRSGGSEYTINGSRCRLLDIQELLSDSGLGREMHVIVGQGQLDQVLHATPEQRRGFIEEAAGVLKHRRRRERTVRKLESMQTNLDRLEDLVQEISRQLAPLGRQASVARRAQRIQQDVRDARSRLIADDLVQAATALHESSQHESADTQAHERLTAHIKDIEAQLATLTRESEQVRRRAESLAAGHHQLAQLQEKFRSVNSLAMERSRSLADAAAASAPSGRDPQQLLDQAAGVEHEAAEQDQAVEQAKQQYQRSTEARQAVEGLLTAEETRLTEQLRAVADRRAGLATLKGRVETAAGRRDAAQARQQRAADQHEAETVEAQRTAAELSDLEQRIAELETGESALTRSLERSRSARDQAREHHKRLTEEHRAVEIELSEHRARLSGVEAARSPKDGAAALIAEHPELITGRYADQLTVTPGWERAAAAAVGSLDTALAVTDAPAATRALDYLHTTGGGRAHLVYPVDHSPPQNAPEALPEGAHPAQTLVSAEGPWRHHLAHALQGVIFTDRPDDAAALLEHPGVVAVITDTGAVHRRGEVIGGTEAEHTDIALAAQVEKLSAQISAAEERLSTMDAQLAASQHSFDAAEHGLSEALDSASAGESALRAATEQMNRLRQENTRAHTRVRQWAQEIEQAQTAAEDATAQWHEVTARAEAAEDQDTEEDPSTDERDRLNAEASQARREEVDARLGLRAAEEQLHQLRERAAGLRRAAQAEEHRREQARQAAQRRNQRSSQAATVAQKAQTWVDTLTQHMEQVSQAESSARAQHAAWAEQITTAQQQRTDATTELGQVTQRLHHAEVRRTELRLALETAETRAAEELSLTSEYLIEHYGPDQLVPDPDDPEGDGVPYRRTAQEARLKRATRDLNALGKVNPLALEEHAALQERHTYLQNQLADLKNSRQDLLDIITEVDSTVHAVFTEAWKDTEEQFRHVFARLFPGGEGRLELTSPEDMLNTGIEVHARPPGKRIRRLSLLSGGERSLTAVALLVAIFKARPSPFYVMDEVEAALDDTNLSRLLVIFEELRENSQLIVITHQKRTMEVADALYGVSMRQDGSTRVVSQRLRQEAGNS